MAIRMNNVQHPKTGRCSCCTLRPDGKWEFPDGTVVAEGEIRSAFAFSPVESLMVLIIVGLAVACGVKSICTHW